MNGKKYEFSTPYDRDNRLIVRPIYTTTHNSTYIYFNRSKYGYVKSKYKQQIPFVRHYKTKYLSNK